MISDSIPIELILEILLRLPSKSIARFHCVSKLWASVLDGPYFTELFLTRSSARPRLLFAIEKNGLWSIFSLPQHLSPYEKKSSSLVLTAEFHMKFPPENMRIYCYDGRGFSCGYASGLICFDGMWIKGKYYYVPVKCNPITGWYSALPYLQSDNRAYRFFGFDPIDKQYKVLFIAKYPYSLDRYKILTLGTGKMRWRRIKCSLRHDMASEGICINGVLYYLGREASESSIVIVCFDVRSEKFKFIYLFTYQKNYCQLINYKGKLGVIYFDEYVDDANEFRVRILEDAEKHEWLEYAYTMRDDIFLDNYSELVVGVTATGEIVFSMGYFNSEKPFHVFYLNPERNTLQRVEIQGFGRYHEGHHDGSKVYVFANQVEDLNVNDPKLLKSSIYAPYLKTEKKKNKKKEKMMKRRKVKESKIETSIVVR